MYRLLLSLYVAALDDLNTNDYSFNFVDFANALTNPIAFQSKADQRGHMLESLMDDDEASSQVNQT